jgi:hypothetical protein
MAAAATKDFCHDNSRHFVVTVRLIAIVNLQAGQHRVDVKQAIAKGVSSSKERA